MAIVNDLKLWLLLLQRSCVNFGAMAFLTNLQMKVSPILFLVGIVLCFHLGPELGR